MLAALLGDVEQRLHAHAYAEEWPVGVDVLAQRLDEAGRTQVGHRVGGRADAGQDQRPRALDRLGIRADLEVVAGVLDGPRDAAQVARAVVDDHRVGHAASRAIDGSKGRRYAPREARQGIGRRPAAPPRRAVRGRAGAYNWR